MKKNLKNLLWLGLPLCLAVGCAENRRDASVSYSPALTGTYSPTGDRDASRVYTDTQSGIDLRNPPPGANAQDWQLAEEIRSFLTTHNKLGRAQVVAVVNNGVVTLKGGVRNNEERQRLREEIAQLPGVQRVDDEMERKNPTGIGAGETKDY
ncbi:MAG TPA: BON domain-containing protein [Verrucomicrobiae bacterium]|jgi:osmotically-inducible protein OsmY|nr:BON domain-containing protein [Verrucomicrobiae bacterium]